MADCYKFKERSDIDKNFTNNLDIVISLTKFHTDVFWDIGRDVKNISATIIELMQKQLRNSFILKNN